MQWVLIIQIIISFQVLIHSLYQFNSKLLKQMKNQNQIHLNINQKKNNLVSFDQSMNEIYLIS